MSEIYSDRILNASVNKIYLAYDRPLIYSLVDQIGTFYFLFWVDDTEMWLCLPISPLRLKEIETGRLSVKIAFEQYEIKPWLIPHESENSHDCDKFISNIPDDLFLAFESDAISDKISLPNISAYSGASLRNVIDFALKDEFNSHVINIAALGIVFDSLSATAQSLGMNQAYNGKKISENVRVNTRINASAFFHSSFGIRLETQNLSIFDLQDEDYFIGRLSSLMEVIGNNEGLLENLKKYNLLSRVRFKNLLKSFSSGKLGFSWVWVSPTGRVKEVTKNLSQIVSSYNFILAQSSIFEEEIEYSGELVGIDVDKNSFDLISDGGETIKGNINSNINRSEFTIPSSVVVVIRQSATKNSVTGSEQWSYELIRFIDDKGERS